MTQWQQKIEERDVRIKELVGELKELRKRTEKEEGEFQSEKEEGVRDLESVSKVEERRGRKRGERWGTGVRR